MNKPMNSSKDDARDLFQTPPAALVPLLPFLCQFKTIWEPAEGKRNIVRTLIAEGLNVVGTDIMTGTNFLTCDVPAGVQAIVTNPPYSKSEAFVDRCFDIALPFALLMPVEYLGGQKRQQAWKLGGLEIVMLGRRINFETPTGEGSGAQFETAWFTFNMNIREIAEAQGMPTFGGVFLETPITPTAKKRKPDTNRAILPAFQR